MRIYSASNVAACIGINPYEDISDALESLWIKEDKNAYYKLVNTLKPKTSLAQKRKDLKYALSSSEATLVKDIQQDSTKNVTEKINDIISIPNSTLTQSQHTALIKHCKSSTNTQHGRHKESSTLDLYAHQFDKVVKPYNVLNTRKYNSFAIRGKVDGIVPLDDNNFEIIEIKNRTRRLFNQVKNYEYCQVQCYLFINNQQHCNLVEHFNGQIQSYSIQKDDSYIQSLLTKLEKFNLLFDNLQSIKQLQYTYMTSDDKNDFILQYINT
tara:strand:- start:14226 stop:15029 length:804 start_codon:yes stop_codon:yes gene_type:complete